MQDSYTQLASTYLGVSHTIFGKTVDTRRVQESFVSNENRIEIENILKTILERPALIDDVLNVLDAEFFGEYREIFDLILKEDFDNPLMMGIVVDENIKVMDEVGLKKSLLWILEQYYHKMLKDIAHSSDIDFNKKSFLLRKIRNDIIPRLKRGELIAFERLI
jgi:DNA primase